MFKLHVIQCSCLYSYIVVQDDEVGDGPMSMVVLEGELLQETEKFKVKCIHIHPTTIIEGIVCIDVKPFTFQSLYLISFVNVMTLLISVGWDIILTFTFAYKEVIQNTMFKRVQCLYIVDIQTCICVHGYTRLRGILDVEAPTFCDACFSLGSLTRFFFKGVFLESAIAFLRSFTNLIGIIQYAPFISKQCLNRNAMLVLIIEQCIKKDYHARFDYSIDLSNCFLHMKARTVLAI